MVAIAIMVFVVFLAVVVGALVITRSATLDYEKTEERLHEPGAETLVYDVPNGQDPVALTVALARAGFTAVEDTDAGTCRVLVDCPRGRSEDRAAVRTVIEQVRPVRSGGASAVVQFADER